MEAVMDIGGGEGIRFLKRGPVRRQRVVRVCNPVFDKEIERKPEAVVVEEGPLEVNEMIPMADILPLAKNFIKTEVNGYYADNGEEVREVTPEVGEQVVAGADWVEEKVELEEKAADPVILVGMMSRVVESRMQLFVLMRGGGKVKRVWRSGLGWDDRVYYNGQVQVVRGGVLDELKDRGWVVELGGVWELKK